MAGSKSQNDIKDADNNVLSGKQPNYQSRDNIIQQSKPKEG